MVLNARKLEIVTVQYASEAQ